MLEREGVGVTIFSIRVSALILVNFLLAKPDAEAFADSMAAHSDWKDASLIAAVESSYNFQAIRWEREIGDSLHASVGLWQVYVYYSTLREYGDTTHYRATFERLMDKPAENFKDARLQFKYCEKRYRYRWSQWACQNAGMRISAGAHYANKVLKRSER